jgi:hypothetical protein
VSEEELGERCIGDRDMVATQSYEVKAECGPWVVQVTSNFHEVCMGHVLELVI